MNMVEKVARAIDQIIERQRAVSENLPRYFTGRPCLLEEPILHPATRSE